MSTPRRPPTISWTDRLFAPLALALLLVGATAVSAQDNANGVNSNNGNQNVNVNRNANANAGANVNANGNANANRNGNAGQNANGNTNVNQNIDNANAARTAEIMRQGLLVGTWWYPFLVTAIFVVVLGFFAYAIYRSVRFSKSTFNSPLGLPEGSLRAMLAFLLVVFVGLYVYASVLSFSDFQPPQFLLGIVATVIGFYFGSRTGEERAGGRSAQVSGAVEGTVRDNAGAPAPGATVELTTTDGKKLNAKAGADGKYKIDNVLAGEHDIEAKAAANAAGQPSGRTKVTVKAGETATANLTLK
jgi:hypothetical protein